MKKIAILTLFLSFALYGCGNESTKECCNNSGNCSDSLCVTKCDSIHTCSDTTSCK